MANNKLPARRCQYCNKLINLTLTDGSFFAYKIINSDPPSTTTVFTHVECFFEKFNTLVNQVTLMGMQVTEHENVINEICSVVDVIRDKNEE